MSEIIYGDIELHRADRQPCVVCGHPTGDCSSHEVQLPKVLLGVGVYETLKQEEMVPVEEDVYEDRWISPFTKVRIKVAKQGTAIPRSKAIDIGIISE